MKDFPEVIKNGDLEWRHIKPTFELAKELFDILSGDRVGDIMVFSKLMPEINR